MEPQHYTINFKLCYDGIILMELCIENVSEQPVVEEISTEDRVNKLSIGGKELHQIMLQNQAVDDKMDAAYSKKNHVNTRCCFKTIEEKILRIGRRRSCIRE